LNVVITYFNYLWDIDGVSAGSAIKAKEFIRAINQLGHTAYLEWRTPQPNGSSTLTQKAKERLKPRLQKYLHEPKRLGLNLSHLLQEYRIFKRQKPDIFFYRLELYTFSGTWLSKWLGIPMVVEADCPPTYEHTNFYGKHYKHLGSLPARIESQTLRAADAVIVISNILKDYYVKQGIPAAKMHVIPNGADPEKFKPAPKDHELSQKYHLADKVVVGWIGSLVGWSGIENLIDAAREILAARPEVCFMMVGGGKNQEFFREKLQTGDHAGRVILPGLVPHEHVSRYLSCMDIVMAPYPKLDFWYPSSMKLFEYMSAGKAVVATGVGQMREIVQDGVNGYLFDPDIAGELYQKLITLIDAPELRQRVAAQARRDIEEKWNWNAHAKKMIEIFAEVLQRRRRAVN
jgi:glycosyltransferase involved in cell wall biosynthesis